jgi:hypothetical protein
MSRPFWLGRFQGHGSRVRTVPEVARTAVAGPQISAGESGAAGVAGLLSALAHEDCRRTLKLASAPSFSPLEPKAWLPGGGSFQLANVRTGARRRGHEYQL